MSARAGVVYLVGAGPGDPGLMTARSLELLASADTILHDRLIPAGALDGARDDAELVYVGKRPGDNAIEQGAIEALMVERARAGRSVVRPPRWRNSLTIPAQSDHCEKEDRFVMCRSRTSRVLLATDRKSVV